MPRKLLPPAEPAPYDTTPAPQSFLDEIKAMGYDIVNTRYTTQQAAQIMLSKPVSDAKLRYLQQQNYDTTNGCTIGQYTAALKEIQGA